MASEDKVIYGRIQIFGKIRFVEPFVRQAPNWPSIRNVIYSKFSKSTDFKPPQPAGYSTNVQIYNDPFYLNCKRKTRNSLAIKQIPPITGPPAPQKKMITVAIRRRRQRHIRR
ncbi:hypothetical protein TSAR_013637, partial [Trichomalopsis sarcophagae]